ncbi:MAG TPA: hypothetical protein VNY73_03655 [Bacteroidia bacterium]|jgi:hypothetical protein|nr:hypothetical protein [Bacteroidia bacterium]
MVKKTIVLLVLFSMSLHAQDSTRFRYHSLLKASATITPGYLLNRQQTNIYINGFLEYFPENKVSLRGESFVMVGAQQAPALLNQNSCLLFGAAYHFHKNRFDYFIGLETGAALTKPNDTEQTVPSSLTDPAMPLGTNITVTYTTSYAYKILPVIAPVTGITFHASNYFNFFLNVHYIKARYFGYQYGKTLLLDELRISAGLGFSIHLKKKT